MFAGITVDKALKNGLSNSTRRGGGNSATALLYANGLWSAAIFDSLRRKAGSSWCKDIGTAKWQNICTASALPFCLNAKKKQSRQNVTRIRADNH